MHGGSVGVAKGGVVTPGGVVAEHRGAQPAAEGVAAQPFRGAGGRTRGGVCWSYRK